MNRYNFYREQHLSNLDQKPESVVYTIPKPVPPRGRLIREGENPNKKRTSDETKPRTEK